MIAALRWIERRSGSDVVCPGRRDFLPLYLRDELSSLGAALPPDLALGTAATTL